MRIEHNFAGAGTVKRAVSGRYLNVKSADYEVLISSVGIEPVHIGPGETYDLGENFSHKEIQIQNTVTSANSVAIEVTARPLVKTSQNNFNVTTTATVEVGDDNAHLPKVAVAAGATVAVCTANAARKYLRVTLLSDAAGYVLMGKSGVNGSSGGPIEPGQTSFEDTTGALWVHNPQSVSVDVWLMEVSKL